MMKPQYDVTECGRSGRNGSSGSPVMSSDAWNSGTSLRWTSAPCSRRAASYSPSVVENRFMIQTTHRGRPWIIIAEPDPEERVLVIVTAYESRR